MDMRSSSTIVIRMFPDRRRRALRLVYDTPTLRIGESDGEPLPYGCGSIRRDAQNPCEKLLTSKADIRYGRP